MKIHESIVMFQKKGGKWGGVWGRTVIYRRILSDKCRRNGQLEEPPFFNP